MHEVFTSELIDRGWQTLDAKLKKLEVNQAAPER